MRRPGAPTSLYPPLGSRSVFHGGKPPVPGLPRTGENPLRARMENTRKHGLPEAREQRRPLSPSWGEPRLCTFARSLPLHSFMDATPTLVAYLVSSCATPTGALPGPHGSPHGLQAVFAIMDQRWSPCDARRAPSGYAGPGNAVLLGLGSEHPRRSRTQTRQTRLARGAARWSGPSIKQPASRPSAPAARRGALHRGTPEPYPGDLGCSW